MSLQCFDFQGPRRIEHDTVRSPLPFRTPYRTLYWYWYWRLLPSHAAGARPPRVQHITIIFSSVQWLPPRGKQNKQPAERDRDIAVVLRCSHSPPSSLSASSTTTNTTTGTFGREACLYRRSPSCHGPPLASSLPSSSSSSYIRLLRSDRLVSNTRLPPLSRDQHVESERVRGRSKNRPQSTGDRVRGL